MLGRKPYNNAYISFSVLGLEYYSDSMFKELVSKEGLVKFISNDYYVSAMTFTDSSGNEMWSVNVIIGTEDEILASDTINIRAYSR